MILSTFSGTSRFPARPSEHHGFEFAVLEKRGSSTDHFKALCRCRKGAGINFLVQPGSEKMSRAGIVGGGKRGSCSRLAWGKGRSKD